MKFQRIGRLFLVFSILAAGFQVAVAQDERLTLAEILTGLQSQSSGLSLSQKNQFITQRVKTRGVTFRLSTEIRNELQRAGASPSLIAAIGANGPAGTTPVRSDANNIEFDRLWVTYNVVEEGVKGMRVHTKFTVRNMKDEPLYLTVRFQKENGDVIESENQNFRNKGGQLAVFKKLTPGYANSVYNDYNLFIPYREIVLPPGKHNLKLDADIIYESGDLLKHLKLHPFVLTKPAPSSGNPNVTFSRMWVDHNVTVGGVRGMRVHAAFTARNLLNKKSTLSFELQKRDGTAIIARSQRYKNANGRLTATRSVTPRYNAANFSDASIFVPYSELAARGTRQFRIHADLLYPPNGNLHLTFFNLDVPSTVGLSTANSTAPSAKSNSISVRHNVRKNGKLGMEIIADITVYNLKNQPIEIAVGIQDRNGRKIDGRSGGYRSTNGQLTVYKKLNPAYDAARFRNQRLFIPYSEFNIARGFRSLQAHVDVLYGNGKDVHIAYHNFSHRFR